MRRNRAQLGLLGHGGYGYTTKGEGGDELKIPIPKSQTLRALRCL